MKNKNILIIGTIAVTAIGLFAFSKKKASVSVPAELVNKNTSTVNREELAKELTKLALNSKKIHPEALAANQSQQQQIKNDTNSSNAISSLVLTASSNDGFWGGFNSDKELAIYESYLNAFNQISDDEVLKMFDIFKKQINQEVLTLDEKLYVKNFKTKYPNIRID